MTPAAEQFELGFARGVDYPAAFWRFHQDNPRVYEMFKRFTFRAIRAGFTHYSAKSICERMRWHTDIETRDEEFRLNNNYTAYYARLFMEDHPQHDGFFRKRERGE